MMQKRQQRSRIATLAVFVGLLGLVGCERAAEATKETFEKSITEAPKKLDHLRGHSNDTPPSLDRVVARLGGSAPSSPNEIEDIEKMLNSVTPRSLLENPAQARRFKELLLKIIKDGQWIRVRSPAIKKYLELGFDPSQVASFFRMRLEKTQGPFAKPRNRARAAAQSKEIAAIAAKIRGQKTWERLTLKAKREGGATTGAYRSAREMTDALETQIWLIEKYTGILPPTSFLDPKPTLFKRRFALHGIEVLGARAVPLLLDVLAWNDYPLFSPDKGTLGWCPDNPRLENGRAQKEVVANDIETILINIGVEGLDEALRYVTHVKPVLPPNFVPKPSSVPPVSGIRFGRGLQWKMEREGVQFRPTRLPKLSAEVLLRVADHFGERGTPLEKAVQQAMDSPQ